MTVYSRFYRRENTASLIILLILLAFLVVIAYYVYSSGLFTASFGFLGILSQVRQRISTALRSVTTFFSGIFGMFIDAVSGFSNAVIVSALNGNIAAWIWLFGYVYLMAVLIWNFIATHGRTVIR